jgi:hypothetical protein
MEEFKYFGTTLTNKNYLQEEINSGLKLGNACLLLFGAESFVFKFAIQKSID